MIDKQLQLILEWKDPVWTQDMVLAFRLGQIYMELEKKYFPTESRAKYPKKGDPRTSELFRLCYKMVNDNKDKLKPQEYRLFMQAQLSILKNIKAGPASQLFYGPRCLIGDPAWGRWVVWSKYAKAQKVVESSSPEPVENYTEDLLKTKTLLENKLKPLNKDTMNAALVSGQIFRLAMLKVISPIFLRACPLVQKYISSHPEVSRLYDVKITEPLPKEVVLKYDELFACLN
jgi:hypothetical protein